ncbi:SigE family RNA polymerase sigma factor [Actinomycetes bacterium KLBMP 9797]
MDEGKNAFEDYVRARSAALLRYGYVLTGNPHDAADLVQEALARLGSAWSRVRRKEAPEAYVRTTMARLHAGRWRRLRRERPVEDVPERGYADAGISRAEAESGLWRALACLPRRQRAVLVLRYYEHLSDEEIAGLLGVSRGTVRSQAARALDKLRANWAPANAPERMGKGR